MFLFEDSCDIVVLRTGDGQRCWCHSLAAREGTPRIEECFPVVGEARPTSRCENLRIELGGEFGCCAGIRDWNLILLPGI